MMYNKYMLAKYFGNFIWAKWEILGKKWVMVYKKIHPSEIKFLIRTIAFSETRMNLQQSLGAFFLIRSLIFF